MSVQNVLSCTNNDFNILPLFYPETVFWTFVLSHVLKSLRHLGLKRGLGWSQLFVCHIRYEVFLWKKFCKCKKKTWKLETTIIVFEHLVFLSLCVSSWSDLTTRPQATLYKHLAKFKGHCSVRDLKLLFRRKKSLQLVPLNNHPMQTHPCSPCCNPSLALMHLQTCALNIVNMVEGAELESRSIENDCFKQIKCIAPLIEGPST